MKRFDTEKLQKDLNDLRIALLDLIATFASCAECERQLGLGKGVIWSLKRNLVVVKGKFYVATYDKMMYYYNLIYDYKYNRG